MINHCVVVAYRQAQIKRTLGPGAIATPRAPFYVIDSVFYHNKTFFFYCYCINRCINFFIIIVVFFVCLF